MIYSRAALGTVVGVFLLSRALILLIGYIAQVQFPLGLANPDRVFAHILPLDPLARWDAGWYVSIVTEGYSFQPDAYSNVAFFPFYPLAIGATRSLTGLAPPTCGILVSNCAFFCALFALHRFTEREFDAPAADRAVAYAAFYPAAFYFSAVYTESLFLLLAVGALWFARRRQWLLAAVAAAAASATRPVGIVLWGALGLEWLRLHRWSLVNGLRRDWRGALAIQLSPLGLVAYMAFLYGRFGDPLVFVRAQQKWGRLLQPPLQPFYDAWSLALQKNWLAGVTAAETRLLLDTAALALALAAAIWAGRRMGGSYGAFCLLGVLIPASSHTESMLRYTAVLFPIYLALAAWGRRPTTDRLILGGCAALLALWLSLFASLNFAG